MAADTDLKKKHKMFTTGPPPMNPNRHYVNEGEEDQMEVEGYAVCRAKLIMVYFWIIMTAGILLLFFHWLPHWFVWATHKKCGFAEATTLLFKDQYRQWFVSKVHTITKDGTRVAVLQPSVTFTLSAKAKRQQARLLLNTGQHDENLFKYCVVKRVKYIWNPSEDKYQKLRGLEVKNTCSYFHEAKGLSYEHQRKRRVLYGLNSIAVHVTPVLSLLFKEAFSPFYVFQMFSMGVWYFDEYYYYATCIIIISLISLGTSIYQTRKMQRALRNTIQTSTTVTVCRGDERNYEDIQSEDIVPGDVIVIPPAGCVMTCDAVLITGNCIVNESMLTGESVPVTKTPVPDTRSGNTDEVFNMKEHAKHTLFCGTHVIQTRYYGEHKVKAVVLKTGFFTSKGELVRAILYPKPVDFKFNRDTYFFICVLAFISCIGLVYTVILKAQRGDPTESILRRSLDLITIAVPPALPAALTVGIVFAQQRMKNSAIYCISPRSINLCGSINVVCFDKTGTLTEDGLNLHGVVSVEDGKFGNTITNMILLRRGLMMEAMATCHSLTLIEGRLSGDPLDLIMFQSIDWCFVEPGQENARFDMLVPTIVYPRHIQNNLKATEDIGITDNSKDELAILRQFTFSSSLQRMSVIVGRSSGRQYELFCKGSPEMITSLCKPESVPRDYLDVLKLHTQYGYRVLALAWKPLPLKYNYVKVQRVSREKMENEMTFLGLLIMENKLKPETTPVIEQLNEANIKTIMVTGDNILTALSVAHDCKMVSPKEKVVLVEAQLSDKAGIMKPCVQFIYETLTEHQQDIYTDKGMPITAIQMQEEGSCDDFRFAVTGKSWEILKHFFPEILSKVLVRGVVFARMSPDQKAHLIESLQDLGYYVAMCGDGANDCGALKTAHTGISLSEAEASVASPFTSKNPNIECVPTVIREGRAALVTSFGIFKYMACYSLTQFVSVIILYRIKSNLTDFEFLYIDLILLTSLSVTYGRTEAFPKLSKDPPQLRLTSAAPILSLVLQMFIQMSVQIFCFVNVQAQPWFLPHETVKEHDYASYENTVIFSSSIFQYVILAVAFSKGTPYRKNMFTNYWFLLNIVVCLALNIWLTVYPVSFIVEFFKIKPPPSILYRLMLLGVALTNCLLSIFLETFLLDHERVHQKLQSIRGRCCPAMKYRYNTIEEELVTTPGWPPVGANPITASYHTEPFSKEEEEIATECDQMLLDHTSDFNHSHHDSASFSLRKMADDYHFTFTDSSLVSGTVQRDDDVKVVIENSTKLVMQPSDLHVEWSEQQDDNEDLDGVFVSDCPNSPMILETNVNLPHDHLR